MSNHLEYQFFSHGEKMNFKKPTSAIIFLKTNDLAETTRFYSEVMNFEFVLDQGDCRIFRTISNSYLGFCLTEESTGSSEIMITFEVEDVDAARDYFESKGIEIELQPRLNDRFQIYQMFIRDPNGYVIEIQRFLDPHWHAARISNEGNH
jgi:catechol 2,3-dioxygenase-like lactoylglutathione lyase family enzyme